MHPSPLPTAEAHVPRLNGNGSTAHLHRLPDTDDLRVNAGNLFNRAEHRRIATAASSLADAEKSLDAVREAIDRARQQSTVSERALPGLLVMEREHLERADLARSALRVAIIEATRAARLRAARRWGEIAK